jgi:hypothetical protein
MEMNKKADIEVHIALVAGAVEEAFVCIDAATHFARYFMNDKNEEKRCETAKELYDARMWIDRAIKYIAPLRKELEKQ